MEDRNTAYLDRAESAFERCFSEKGYTGEEAAPVTCREDPTVDFIGSKISPLKKYVTEDRVGDPGRYLIQNCVKLRNLKHIREGNPGVFGSYFKCMGTLAAPDLERASRDLFDYLTKPEYLGIPPEDLCIRICSADRDLTEAVAGLDRRIRRETDTRELSHYRHVYGMDHMGIRGRDYNVGLRKKGTDLFVNCAAFAVMETPERKLAVDMGIGNLTLSMCRFGTDTVLEASRMADLLPITSPGANRMADALSVIAILLREGIQEHPSRHFRKKFRQYLNGLCFWNRLYHYSPSFLTDILIEYVSREFKEDCSGRREEWRDLFRSGFERYEKTQRKQGGMEHEE